MAEKKYRVLIKKCDHYDAAAISKMVSAGLQSFGLTPHGTVYLKPNVVLADYDYEIFPPNAFTNRAVIEGVCTALDDTAQVEKISIGEKCGIGIPTRLFYRFAKYDEMIKDWNANIYNATPVEMYSLEEDRFSEKFVGGKIHSYVRLSQRAVTADFKIAVPKLKKHSSVGFTCCAKLNIGAVDDWSRSLRHDYAIEDKIIDLHQAIPYDFYVVDAIEAGVGIETSPSVKKLGLIMMGTDGLAIDMVASHLYNLSSKETYLQKAIERGLGPASLEEIELCGDITDIAELTKLKEKLGPYDQEFFRWHDTNQNLARLNSAMTFSQGPSGYAPEVWCKAGCTMGVEISLSLLERYDLPSFKTSEIAVIIGQHETIDCRGKTALLIGKCTKVEHLLNAKKVIKVDKCFTTTLDILPRLIWYGKFKNPLIRPRFIWSVMRAVTETILFKIFHGRYLQEIIYFFKNNLLKKI